MIELEFLGRSGDGMSVIFTDEEGERYCADITEDLRAALRREHPRNEGVRTNPSPTSLRPRDIQALLREGISAADIAEQQGIELSAITKYESPVLAERAWIISKAQLARVGEGPDAPILEDLVINRLATRGVDHTTLSWAALRRPGEDWEVTLTFIQGAIEQTATWSVSTDGATLTALDQEAQWLTETASPLAPVSAFFPPRVHEASEEIAAAEDLIDQANNRRGKRQPLLEEIDEVGEVDPQPATDIRAFFSARPIPAPTPEPTRAPSASTEPTSEIPTVPAVVPGDSGEAPTGAGNGNDLSNDSSNDLGADSSAEASVGASAGASGDASAPAAIVPASSGATSSKPTGTDKASSGPQAPQGPATVTRRTRIEKAPSDTALFAAPEAPTTEAGGESTSTKPARKSAKKRRPVPTWDEIVFGSKTE